MGVHSGYSPDTTLCVAQGSTERCLSPEKGREGKPTQVTIEILASKVNVLGIVQCMRQLLEWIQGLTEAA